MLRGQLGNDLVPNLERRAKAVKQDDRWARANVGVVHAHAIDCDEGGVRWGARNWSGMKVMTSKGEHAEYQE